MIASELLLDQVFAHVYIKMCVALLVIIFSGEQSGDQVDLNVSEALTRVFSDHCRCEIYGLCS